MRVKVPLSFGRTTTRCADDYAISFPCRKEMAKEKTPKG